MGDHRVFFSDDGVRKTWLVFNERGQIKGAHVEQQVDDIVEENKRQLLDSHGRPFGDYSRAASIPVTLYEKLGIGEAMRNRDHRYVRRVLNNSDYSGFRTSKGKL